MATGEAGCGMPESTSGMERSAMIHIAICDDERDFVAYLTGLLEKYAAETGEEIRITAYYDGLELTEKYDTTIDLVFLDIQMERMDGLQAAERIRQMDEGVGIIFLTTQIGRAHV